MIVRDDTNDRNISGDGGDGNNNSIKNGIETFGFYEFYVPLSMNKEFSLLNEIKMIKIKIGNIISTSFRDNTIVSNEGRCMTLYDSSMLCDECTFYNMSSNNNNGTIYPDSSRSASTIDTISSIDCSLDGSVALNDGGIIYATTEMELNIIRNNFSDSSATSGDGGIFLNQGYINMTDTFVDTSTSGNNGGFLYVYDSDEIILLNFDCHTCQADNSGGDMYFGLKNTNNVYLKNYASTNSLATNYDALKLFTLRHDAC